MIFDVVAGKRIGMFAGPTGRMWSHDGQLYVSNGAGLEIWDPVGCVRTAFLDGFRPTVQDPVNGTLAEISGGTLRTWRPKHIQPSLHPERAAAPDRSSGHQPT